MVRFTEQARRQFLEGLAYIKIDNPGAAVRFKAKVQRTLARLPMFPHSGRPIPEFPELPYREVIVRPYRFFYRMADSAIWIVAVWHCTQLPRQE